MWQLRTMFNAGHYWLLARRGELDQQLLRNGHPSSDASGEPFCTRSQIIAYFDMDGNEVARVHQYLRADGTVGASGKPDPKRLRQGDTIYYV